MRSTIIGLVIILASSCASPYRNVPLAAPLSYAQAEQALDRGEYMEASQHLSAYLDSGRRTYRARALYQMARARYQMEDYQGAIKSLHDLDDEFPGFGSKQSTALRGDLAYALGNRTDAVLLWEEAYSKSTPAERTVLDPRIASAIRSLSTEEAEELARLVTVPEIYEMTIDRISGPTGTVVGSGIVTAPPDLDVVAINRATVPSTEIYSDEVVVSDGEVRLVYPEDLTDEERLALESSGVIVPPPSVAVEAPDVVYLDENGNQIVVEAAEAAEIEALMVENGNQIVDDADTSVVAAADTSIAAADTSVAAADTSLVAADTSFVGADTSVVVADTSVVVAAVEPAEVYVAEAIVPEQRPGPRVACLLPLTGSGRAEGQRALSTIRQSLDDDSLIIRDTGSDATEARTLLEQLAQDSNVIAVLGPVLPSTINATGASAKRLGLPLVTLRSGAVKTTATANASSRLASHAVHSLGARRIATLAPAAAGNQGFAEAVTAAGAAYVGHYAYDSAEAELSGVLSAVQGWIDAGGLDAVYIEDRATVATRVAAAARAVAPQIILLGSEQWNDAEALTAAGAAIEGAIIATDTPATSSDLNDRIRAASEALRRALLAGDASRATAQTAIARMSSPAAGPTLMKVVDGRPISLD